MIQCIEYFFIGFIPYLINCQISAVSQMVVLITLLNGSNQPPKNSIVTSVKEHLYSSLVSFKPHKILFKNLKKISHICMAEGVCQTQKYANMTKFETVILLISWIELTQHFRQFLYEPCLYLLWELCFHKVNFNFCSPFWQRIYFQAQHTLSEIKLFYFGLVDCETYKLRTQGDINF